MLPSLVMRIKKASEIVELGADRALKIVKQELSSVKNSDKELNLLYHKLETSKRNLIDKTSLVEKS